MSRKVSNWLKIAVGILGGYLTLRLILLTGTETIVSTFRDHARLLLLITTVYLVYHILRTFALQICIPQRTRFWNVFAIRLAGEAIAYIAIGSVLGDTMKVVLARDRIPVVEGATGVFAEKLIYHMAGALFLIGGLSIAVWKLGINRLFIYFFLIAAGFFVGILILLSSGVQPLTRILKLIPVRRPRLRESIARTETSLFQFRSEHPQRFFLTAGLDLASYFYSAAEVFFILWVIGIHPSFKEIWYFVSMVKMANSAAMVVPANLGVFEATHLLLAKQLGLGGANGLIVALFVRLRAILWSLIGYCFFVFLIGKQKRNPQSPSIMLP